MSIPESKPSSKPGHRTLGLQRLRRIFGPARQLEGLSIRRFRAADLPGFFHPEEFALGQNWLARQKRHGIYVAVAEFDGMPVGRACIHYNRTGYPASAYVFASSVAATWRSRGVGSALIAHLERRACLQGMYHISAHTATHNTRAASWFERLGYRRVCEETIHWDEPDGRRVESLCWRFERKLTPSVSQRLVNSVTLRILRLIRRVVPIQRKPN